MSKIALIIIIILLPSCSGQDIKRDNFQIVVEFADSNKVDLTKGIYTTYFMAKPSSEALFILTNDEKNEIIDKYFSVKLGKAKKIIIGEDCGSVPKLYTIINIKSGDFSQQIKYSGDCENYGYDNEKAKKIEDFLSLIRDIINSKKEIQNAPKSDILYY